MVVDKDLGTVHVQEDIVQNYFPVRERVQKVLVENEYDIDSHAVCAIDATWKEREVEVHFEVVVYSKGVSPAKHLWRITFKQS